MAQFAEWANYFFFKQKSFHLCALYIFAILYTILLISTNIRSSRSSGRRNPSASRTAPGGDASTRRQNGHDRERTAEPMSPPPPELNGHGTDIVTVAVSPPPPVTKDSPAVAATPAVKEEERPQQSYLGRF